MATADKRRVVPFHLAGKRIAEVVFSNYPWDPRVRRAAEALAREGANVEVICLIETDDQPRQEVFNGVSITRLPFKRCRGGKLSYLFHYGAFILHAGAILASRTARRRFDLVHVHNMPDVLVFSALVPRMFGAKIILDLHDPMPELMETIFGLSDASFPVRLLRRLETWSIRFADAVITANEACREVFSMRSRSTKISVVMNSPDEEIFPFREPSTPVLAETNFAKSFVVMFHGSFVERNGLDLAVEALGKIRASIPTVELRLFGRSTPLLEKVLERAQTAGLSESIRYMGSKNLEQISQAIGECDVGIVPNHRNKFTLINMPTRIFEFLSQGKPVIAARTLGVLDYFGPAELVLFEAGDADDLAAKIKYVFEHPQETIETVRRGQEIYQMHKWANERTHFLTLIDRLVNHCEESDD